MPSLIAGFEQPLTCLLFDHSCSINPSPSLPSERSQCAREAVSGHLHLHPVLRAHVRCGRQSTCKTSGRIAKWAALQPRKATTERSIAAEQSWRPQRGGRPQGRATLSVMR